MMMIHSFVLSSSWTVMNNDDFTSVQTQARAHTHVHIMTKVSLDASETERLWLRSGRWFDWFWGRGDRSFWRWPVYSLSLPHRCAWLPPTGTPPLTTVKERDLEENITPGGQGPSGDPQETLQRATSVQTRPISSCHASPQSGAVKPETAAKRAVKFQLKFPSRDRLNLLWVCWAFLSSVVRHGFNSAAEQLASMSPSTSFFFDHMTNRFLHTCMAVARSRTPTLRGIMQNSLEFTQRSKNTHVGGNPPIPQRRSRTTKTPETISLSLTRNHPRQYITEASESCFSQTDCCV